MLGPAESTFIGLLLKPLSLGIVFGVILALAFSCQGTGRYLDKLKANFLPALGYSIPTSLIAFVAGYLTGISRSPAVGTIVPAVLTLMAGLNIYFFGVESDNQRGSNSKVLVGYSVFLFSFTFFYAVWSGVTDREIGRTGRLIELSEQERKIKTYRENRDLPPDPPAWILGGDSKENK